MTFHAKPTGYAYFSNFFGQYGGDRGIMDGRAFERVSPWFFFGQITDHDVSFYHAQSLQLIAGEMTATGHHRLFGISGRRVLGLVVPLQEAAPDQAPPIQVPRTRMSSGSNATMSAQQPGASRPTRSPSPRNSAGSVEA